MGSSLTNAQMDLVSLLAQLVELLADLEPRIAHGLAGHLDSVAASNDLHELRSAARGILGMYGGMGSFNDLVLQDRSGALPENQLLNELRAQLHTVAADIVAAG